MATAFINRKSIVIGNLIIVDSHYSPSGKSKFNLHKAYMDFDFYQKE